MKTKISQWVVAIAVAMGMWSISAPAEAYHCRWVPAHWENGYRVPGRNVCWSGNYYRGNYYRRNCVTYRGYWRHGYWHGPRTICR